MEQMIRESGGIRPFCKRTGINRQVIYNILRGANPDYGTICHISAGLSLEGKEIGALFFTRRGE